MMSSYTHQLKVLKQPKVKSWSLKYAAWTQYGSKFNLTFAITASLARAAMRDSLSDGRNDYKSWRQNCAVYTLLRSVNVCSRANQTATSAQPLEQHVQTQQRLRDDVLKDSAPFSGGKLRTRPRNVFLHRYLQQWDFTYTVDSGRRCPLSLSLTHLISFAFSICILPLGRQKKPLRACQRSK